MTGALTNDPQIKKENANAEKRKIGIGRIRKRKRKTIKEIIIEVFTTG